MSPITITRDAVERVLIPLLTAPGWTKDIGDLVAGGTEAAIHPLPPRSASKRASRSPPQGRRLRRLRALSAASPKSPTTSPPQVVAIATGSPARRPVANGCSPPRATTRARR